MKLHTEGLYISYENQKNIVKDLNLSILEGKITAFIGANGSGKSTILKTIARILKPDQGSVVLDGKNIHTMNTKEVSKLLTLLPQNPDSPEGLTVDELVAYGRIPHRGAFSPLTKEDREIMDWAQKVTNVYDFKDRPLNRLSGGQRQRVWIAMAVAQSTDILFLDEPTTFLDIAHQMEVLNLLQELNKQSNRTIVMVLHDLNQAAQYADYIVAIKDGTVVKEGVPKEVITPEVCAKVFGIKADIVINEKTNTPLCIPYGLYK